MKWNTFEIVIVGVLTLVLVVLPVTLYIKSIEAKHEFDVTCTKLGGIPTHNGNHWVCLK